MGKDITKTGRVLMLVFMVNSFMSSVYAQVSFDNNDVTGDTLSLDRCIEIALENSPDIEISRASVYRSEMSVSDARAEFIPKVSLNGEYNVNNIYNELEWNSNHYNLGISASFTPFSSGRQYLSKQIAEASLSSSREGLRLSRMNLVMEIITGYYNLLEATQILELRESVLEQKEKQLEFSKVQFELGIVPRADTLKARAALEGARLDLHEANGQLRLRRAELNKSMGLELEVPVSVKSVELENRSIPQPESMLNLAFEERPDIRQQESLISSSKYNLYIARINRMPSFTISGGYEVLADPFVFDGQQLNSENWDDNTNWVVSVGLSFPLFDGGVKSRDIARAGIDLNNARLSYENVKRQVELEVKSAYINLENASRKIDLTDRQVNSNEESYEAALGRYQNGIAPITEVIDAEVALTESRVNQISAKYDFLVSSALLKKASGVLYSKEDE